MRNYHSLAVKAYRQRVTDILGLEAGHIDDAMLGGHLESLSEPVYCAKTLCLDGYYLGNRPRQLF